MDKALRSQLYTTVIRCRALLEEDLGLQLEGAYGVHGDGRVEPLAGLTHANAVTCADQHGVELRCGTSRWTQRSLEGKKRMVNEGAYHNQKLAVSAGTEDSHEQIAEHISWS